MTPKLSHVTMYALMGSPREPVFVPFGLGEAETPSQHHVIRDLSKPCCSSTRSPRIPVEIKVRRVVTTAFDCADIVERWHRMATFFRRDTVEEMGLQISITMLVSLGTDVER